uniref:Calcium-binding ef hand family protein isoform 1 n=1 Tax=Tetraselmis sp. GSL018 TaxID=582737 RepID=A0A061R5D3_9CHLO
MKTEAFLLVLFSVSQISTCSGGLWSLFGGSSSPAKKEESQTKVHRRLAPGVLVEKGHLKMDPKRERAMFDPEVASHEPDADLEYLGYDQDEDFDDDFDHYRYGYWGRFNATERLLEIFPQIDRDGNGFVEILELHDWHHQNGMNASMRRAEMRFNSSDTDGDNMITLKEYLPEHYHQYFDMEKPPEEEDHVDEDGEFNVHRPSFHDWKYATRTASKFRAADANRDGGLQFLEFFSFLHPEESNSSDLHMHVIQQEISNTDRNDDNRVTLDEFMDDLWHMFYSWDDEDLEYHYDPERDRQRGAKKFQELDGDQDGYIVAAELMPVFFDLHPTEKHYSKIQAKDVLQTADEDKVSSCMLPTCLHISRGRTGSERRSGADLLLLGTCRMGD